MHRRRSRRRLADSLCILPEISPEPQRPAFLEPFTPGIEGVFGQAAFLTELLHGDAAALLCGDSFRPLIRFWIGRPLFNGSVAHDTTMQRWQVRQEERFTSRLRLSGHFRLTLPPSRRRVLFGHLKFIIRQAAPASGGSSRASISRGWPSVPGHGAATPSDNRMSWRRTASIPGRHS